MRATLPKLGEWSNTYHTNDEPETMKAAMPSANPTLTLSAVTPAQAGRYNVVLTVPGGSATSAPASMALFGLEWALGGGGIQPLLVLDCTPGTSFRLEHSLDLSPASWSLLAHLTPGSSQPYFVDASDTNHAAWFYRAVPQ